MSQIQVFVRNVYGLPKVYPVGDTATKFASLLQVKTFSDQQLAGIEGLGFTIQQVEDPATTLSRRNQS